MELLWAYEAGRGRRPNKTQKNDARTPWTTGAHTLLFTGMAAKKGASGARHELSFEALLREQEEEARGGGARGGKRAKAEGGGSSSGGGGKGEEEEGFVPARLSQRILAAAKEQAQDEGEEQWDAMGGGGSKRRVRFGGAVRSGAGGGARGASAADVFLASRKGKGKRSAAVVEEEGEDEDDEGEDGEEGEDEDELAIDLELEEDDAGGGGGGSGSSRRGGSVYGVSRGGGGSGGGEAFVDAAPDFDAGGAEAAVLARFMPEEASKRRTLADGIREKLAERAAAAAAGGGGGAAAAAAAAAEGEASDLGAGSGGGLDPRIIQVYTDVGRFLSSYKAGKVPKVFKVIPSLPNWEEILFLTNPETWTPHATYQATRIFVSSLKDSKAQRFNALVLLPKCRDDVFAHKRLNFHLYLALRKAAYKPAAFYKGLLLPLAAGGDCTLREALIVGSVVARESFPVLHSAAAIIKLTRDMPYTGAVSVFLRYLLNKKYSLPTLALEAVVAHFCAFEGTPGPLPLIWHQALLALAQRYKGDLSPAHRAALQALCAKHAHAGITPEVRRELAAPAAAEGGGAGAAPAQQQAAAAAAAAAAQARAPRAPRGGARGGGRGMAEEESEY